MRTYASACLARSNLAEMPRRPDRMNSKQRLLIVDELRRRGPGRWCAYCHCGVQRADATLDHVVPVSKGVRSVIENLVVACQPCNVRKRDYELGRVTVEHPHWYGPAGLCLLCGRQDRKRRSAPRRSSGPVRDMA